MPGADGVRGHQAFRGFPLHFLQKQLGHNNIQQTMCYAQFHPDYQEVEPYYATVADKWGVESVVFAQRPEHVTAGGTARTGASTTRHPSDRTADAKPGTWVYFSRRRFLTTRIFGMGQVKDTGVWSGDLVLYVAGGSVHQPTFERAHMVAGTDRNLVGILRTAEDALVGLTHADPRVQRGTLEALADLPVGGEIPAATGSEELLQPLTQRRGSPVRIVGWLVPCSLVDAGLRSSGYVRVSGPPACVGLTPGRHHGERDRHRVDRRHLEPDDRLHQGLSRVRQLLR